MGADEEAIDRIMDSPLGFNVGRMTRYAEDWYTILAVSGSATATSTTAFAATHSVRNYLSRLPDSMWINRI
jgi:hypothetical protein